MEKTKGYIVWFTPANRKFVRTYEEAWRYAEDQFQKSGTAAFVEAVN